MVLATPIFAPSLESLTRARIFDRLAVAVLGIVAIIAPHEERAARDHPWRLVRPSLRRYPADTVGVAMPPHHNAQPVPSNRGGPADGIVLIGFCNRPR